MLAHVPLELRKELVFARHLHHVVLYHLTILVVANGNELKPRFRVVQQSQLIEHAGKLIVKLVYLDRGNKQGVRILYLKPYGH